MKRILNILALIFGVVVFVLIASYYRNTKTTNTSIKGSDSINNVTVNTGDSINTVAVDTDDSIKKAEHRKVIINDTASLPVETDTKNIAVDSIVDFAKTLIGTPYKYGSTDPALGFDCSGFITHVFNHFHIKVPRSSIEFTNVGKEIPVQESLKGDLILFTGTDSTERFIGHMGIIVSNDNGDLQFIHSSSGKANGVVVTTLNAYYRGRFIKVIRI